MGDRRCNLCNSYGHLMRNCTLNMGDNINKQIKQSNYASGVHKHLSYVNTRNIKAATNALFILSEFLKLDTSSQDNLLIAIEEMAYNNYNSWIHSINKKDCTAELNTLKGLVYGEINNFISYDGSTIVAKYIVANS